MDGTPPARPPLVVLAPPVPLSGRLGTGDLLLYVGRLAPVPPPQRGAVGDLAAALALIPDRHSRLRSKPENEGDPTIPDAPRAVDSASRNQRGDAPQVQPDQGRRRTSEG